MAVISTVLEIGGLAVVAVGMGLIYLPAGIVIGGLSLVVVGIGVEEVATKSPGTEP